jgi:DNA-binding transcriptional regulator YiaG
MLSVTPLAFRRARARLGLTQAALARQLGVRQETVARWETGVRRIAAPVSLLMRRLVAETTTVTKQRRPR